jgi:hypothetical protein
MDDFENEYIENFSKNSNSIGYSNKEAKNFLDNNLEYLKNEQVDDDKIETSNKVAENLILKLERKKNINIDSIFNFKKIKF